MQNLIIPVRPAVAVPCIPRPKDSHMPIDPLEELNRRQPVIRDRVRGGVSAAQRYLDRIVALLDLPK